MEVVQSNRKSSSSKVIVSTLPLYRSAPPLEVRLEDFELFAMDRLRVLKGISDGLGRGKKPEEMEKLIANLWKENMRHPQANEEANKDVISHFVLRLVYCRTEELRKWFLSMEITLFRYRFRLESSEAQRALMSEFKLPYKAVSNAEFECVKDKLGQVARSMGQTLAAADAIFYKVPFEEVPELVAGRRVFIHKGYAYVAMNQVVSLVVTQFRSYLSKALILTNRKWTSTVREQEMDRLTPIVEALCTSYLGPDYSQANKVGEISLKDIDQIAKISFPLCMRHLFEKVREDHHLKHGGRMQLGLFLKVVLYLHDMICLQHLVCVFECIVETRNQLMIGEEGVGLKLDDALTFWKAEFAPKVSGLLQCAREIAVAPPSELPATPAIAPNSARDGRNSARDGHNHDFNVLFLAAHAVEYWIINTKLSLLIGECREDYTPYSCQKIISSTPGVGDHHGCPYRHFSEENLRAALLRMGVSSRAVEDVMDKVRNRHYQLACTLTFEAVHGSSCDAGINHPNQYFIDSQRIVQSKVDDVNSFRIFGSTVWV
ncbi:putative DNA primase large subunit [Hibiscus syriacus]|uniref:DNA primase large subunit n=1 Tax=Hibiscus syriacus TaxID=106335 RepID=A0A6A3CS95_HIBSY|nr:putative DNA primase large subunit [Hibiscus syriacus]